MFAKIKSVGLYGLESYTVEVECDLTSGLPAFDIVGLPGASVKESRNRVRSSIANCKFDFPVSRITVNLAPANTPKEGPSFDLPIMLALLMASRQIKIETSDAAFIGELSLTGDIRPVKGLLAMAIHARQVGFKRFFVPRANAAEASVVEGIDIYPVDNIEILLNHLSGEQPLSPAIDFDFPQALLPPMPDFSEVKGQQSAKRALEISAAGGHNVLLIGPPGSGKSMLAKRLPSIMPPLSFDESLETTMLHSVAGILPPNTPLIKIRPFRSPHHSVSPAGLSGGGAVPHPGEISLAHNGVLFLDELPEFSRTSIEALRQPLEDGTVTISRVSGSLTYPCSIMLIAAMNPCPCGYYGDSAKPCTCAKTTIQRYLTRVSGPMLDRLDLHVEVPSVEYDELVSAHNTEETSQAILARVAAARAVQAARYADYPAKINANITPDMVAKFCVLTTDASALLATAFNRLGFSARAYDRVVKISRTIADLDLSDEITSDHVAQAIQYRSLDRKYWA